MLNLYFHGFGLGDGDIVTFIIKTLVVFFLVLFVQVSTVEIAAVLMGFISSFFLIPPL